MNPQPDSPFSRVERTLVSVWCYITEAVSRFLRPQPAETANNDPNSIQESNVDDDAPGGMQTGADTSGEETCEEQPFQTVSLLSSSSPAVPWEQCIADVDVKPKQDQENKEDMREEEFGLTGNDHAESEGENACQERQEKSEKKNSDTYEENETTENNEEHATIGSGHVLLKDVVSDEMDSRVEEVEHVSAERLDECLKVVETMKEPQEDDGQEKKEGLEEESKIKDCSSAEKEESNAETGEQRYIKATGVMLGDVNICQDSQQLSLEFSEFSGFAKDEKKEPGKSKTDDEPEQKKSSRAVEDVQQEEHVVSLKPAGREDYPSTGEDQFGPRAHDSAEKMITEDITEHVGPEITQLHICVEESVDKTEDQANAGSKNTVNEEICEEIKKINKVAAAGEDSVGTLTLYGSQDVEQAKEDMEDENSNVEVDKEEDNENSRKMEEEKLCSFSKEEDSNEETGEQMESKAPTVIPGDAKICEDALELSSKQEKSQTETQHPLCQELSDLAEVESVLVADIIEEEPNESAKHEEPNKKSSLAVIDVQKVETAETQSITACEDDRGKAEEEFGLKENISTEQLITKEMTGHQIGQEISGIQQLNMFIEREGVKNIEDQTKAGSAHTENVLICEGMEIKDEVAAAGGDTVSTLRLDSFPQENEDTVLVDESSKIKEHQAEENEEDFKEESGVKLWTIVEEKESNEETEEKREDEGAAVMLGDANIYEETLQLSPELENKSEDGTHSEALHIVSKELSSSTKDEGVWIADTEEEDSSKSETDEEPEDKGSRAAEDVQHDKTVFTPNVTGSKDYPGTGEKQFGLTGQNSAEQLITEDMMEHHLETEKMDTKQLQTLVEKEDIKNTEDQIQVGSNDTVNEPICEEIEKGDERAAPGEDPKSTVSLDGSQILDEALENLKDKANNIQEDKLEKNEEDIEMEHEVKLCTISKEEESNEEGGEQREWEASTARLEDAQICDDALQLSPRQDNSEERRQAETQLVCKELSGLAEDERVLVADTEEEEDPSKSKMDEESKQKGSRAAGDVQDENVLTLNLTSSEDDYGTGEEQFDLKGDDAEQHFSEDLDLEDMTGHQDEQEINVIRQLQTCEGHDGFESKDDQVCVGSDIGKKEICEEIEKRDEKASPREDPKNTVSLDGSQIMEEALEILKDKANNVQEDKLEKHEEDIEMEHEVKLCTISKEEDSNEEGGEQKEGEVSAARLEDAQICEDSLQLSPRQDKSQEKRQAETQLVCKKLSDLAEDERVLVADTEEEDLIKSKMVEEHTQKGSRAAEDVHHENVLTPNITSIEDDYGTGEEQFDLKGDDAEQNFSEDLDLEDMTGHQDEQEINVVQHLQTCEGNDVFESKDDQACVGSDTGKKAICEEIEKRDEKDAAGEDPKSTVSLDGSQIVDEALEILKGEANNIQDDKLEKNEDDIEMGHEVKLCTISKEEDSNEEGGEQKEGEVSPTRLEDAQICEDSLQLSPRKDKSHEKRQAETQLVCKELSDLAEDERVLVADTEEEDLIKSKMDEEHTQKDSRAAEDVHDENVLTPNIASSEDDYGTGEEQFDLKGDDAEQNFSEDLDLEDMTGHHDEQEINVVQHLQTCEGHDVFESKDDQACVGSDTGKKAICEEIEKRDEKDAAGEDPNSTVSLDGSPKDDEAKDSREERSNIQEDEEKENEQNFEKQSGIKLCTVSKEEEKNEETGEQREIEAGVVMLEDGIISGDTLQFSPEKQHASDEKTEELDELIDENVQMTIEDVGLEENVSIPETTTFKEEDLLETIIQNATEKNVTMEDISTDENTEIAAGERLSIEVNEEGCVERVCITTPVTVIAEGESAREINTGFNNIPLGVIEGQAAQSAELDAEAHEETPEAVPEYNNDLESDANSTQSFLEEGNSEEIQNTDLPEEVGVFKSSSTGGAEYLPIGQGSAEDSRNELEFIEKEQTETPRFVEDPEKPKSDNVNLELEQFSEEEKVKIVDTSMKTEFKQSDQEFEEYSEDETGQQDETVEFEIARLSKEAAIDGFGKREALTVDKGADFADESTESLEGQEKRTGINLGPNVQSFSLQDDHGNLKNSEEIKSKLFDVSAVKPLQLEFDAKEQGCTDEGELEMTPLQLGGMSADQMIGKWETSQHLEKTNQSPHRLAEMTQADVTTDIESTDEPKLTTSEGLPLISAVEEKHEGYSEHSAGEHQGVIDEEILDLWIETVMSDDTERSKEEDLSGPGLQKDQVNEESGETSFEDEREEEMKANSEEPASPSETETSLSTFEPGLLDQHFSEKTASTGLLEDINNIPNAGSSSEDVAEFSMPIFDSALVQETTEVTAFSEIRSYQDSGVSSPGECHPIQECATSQEKSDETKEKTGVEISAMCRDTEFEQKTITEDDLLEATVAEISEEIQPLESWQHRKNSQVESERQQFTPLAPEHRSPGDIIKSFPDSSRTELEENLSKVEGPILDFALQRSRIAVKNPRVRPPTDPRSLINMPSVDPTPSTPVSGKALPGVPLGGLGVGIKLPGLGAGFPVLRKTPRALKNEDNPETKSQESTETIEKKEEKSDAAKKDEAPKRPKWMPPGQPGFGNPLMSELKTKLKKTSKE